MLAAQKSGTRVAWLTKPKAFGRFATAGFKKRDIFLPADGDGCLMAVDPCTEYGLALAIEDFVPVLLAGAGTVVLGLAAGRSLPAVRVPALLAGALVTLGGFAKATWKTLVAAEPCRDYPFLEHMLFPCLAFGFAGHRLGALGRPARPDGAVGAVPRAAGPRRRRRAARR